MNKIYDKSNTNIKIKFYNLQYKLLWGLGIGPNPQSPIPNKNIKIIKKSKKFDFILIIL